MTDDARKPLLERFRGGYAAVEEALEGITDEELDRRPAPGEWSAREVVHHLADSEATAFIRLRRVIAEDRPSLPEYDEADYARRLHYDRPIASSLAVLRAVREASVDLLESLTPEEWRREGLRASGPYPVERWLRVYAKHPYDHAEQIRRARGAVG